MKKRLIFGIAILICLVIMASALLLNHFNNTKQEPKTTEKICLEHTFGEYQFDESEHWREYTCGCSESNDKEKHQLTKYASTDENHYLQCICGYAEAPQNHTYDNNGMLCDFCYRAKPCDHIWGDEIHDLHLTLIALASYLPHSAHYLQCNNCSEMKLLLDENENKEYTITLDGQSSNYSINALPTSAKEGSVVTIRVPNLDNNQCVVLQIGDIYALGIAKDDYITTLAFVMPDFDVTLKFEVVDKLHYNVGYYSYFYYHETWLKDIKSDDISEIIYMHSSTASNPSPPNATYTVTDKDEIEEIIAFFKYLPVEHSFPPYPRDIIRDYFYFVLNDGTKYKIKIQNGYYDGLLIDEIPNIPEFENVTVSSK